MFHYHPEEGLSNHAFSDQEYKQSITAGFVFFEIVSPKELQYTYKISHAPFSHPFNRSFGDPVELVMSEPSCGCGFIKNFEEVEVSLGTMQIAFSYPKYTIKIFYKT